jgi:hypothetical protein
MTWPFRGCARIAVVRRYGALPASLLAVALCALSLPAFATPRAADGAPAVPVIKPFPMEKIIAKGTLIYEVTLVTRGPEGLEAKLKPLSPALRRLALLSLIWHGWGRDGLHTFFYLGDASMAPEILEALREPGLGKQRRAFEKAAALFGPIYPRVQYLRDTFFAESKGDGPSPFDSEFDKKLYALGKEFGAKEEYGKALARLVGRSRELSGFVKKMRLSLSDETRLDWLTEQLGDAIGDRMRRDEIWVRLVSWPASYRIIYLIEAFNAEMLNGAVEQYFYNYAGELAPETVAALREAGLEKHARALQDCVDLFGIPYPADTEARRTGWLDPENAGVLKSLRDAILERATGLVDDGKMIDKMIEIARREKILPN